MVAVGPVALYADEDTLKDAQICFSAIDQWSMSHEITCHTFSKLYCCNPLSAIRKNHDKEKHVDPDDGSKK